MSYYTTEVRYICEEAAGLKESVGYKNVNEVIEQARESVFDFDFPIWDENYRPALETKILRHYYTREIGSETVGLWKLRLMTRLNEIMPYYNKLYETSVLDFNPFYDVDYTTTGGKEGQATKQEGEESRSNDTRSRATHKVEDEDIARSSEGTNEGSNSENGSSSNENHNVDLFADTPQGAIITTSDTTNPVTGERVTVQYMTEARTVDDNGSKEYEKEASNRNEYEENGSENIDRVTDISDNESGSRNETKTGTGRYNDTMNYVERVVGKRGGLSYMKLVQELRDILINIDMMIIDELRDLFMLVW